MYDIAVVYGSSPYVTAYPWTPGSGFGAKYSDPATPPTGYGNGVAFCGKTDIAVAHYYGSHVTAYPWTPGSGFGAKYSDPATPPSDEAWDVAFCGATDITVVYESSPYVTAYPWTPGSGFGVKYSDPATPPTGYGDGVAFCGVTDIAVAHYYDPYVTAYPWTPGSGFGVKYSDPATPPTDIGASVAFCGSTDIAVAHRDSPFVTAYPWTPGSGFGVKYSDPATEPGGRGWGVAFCGVTDIAVAHYYDPYVTAYPWTPGSGFGVKYSDPATPPTGDGASVAFCGSTDIAVAHVNDPYVTAYPWTPGSGFGAKYSDPATKPGECGADVAFSAEYIVEAPTVTTQAASSVEATTATGNGNITDIGGERCDKRGIVYDLASHGDPGDTAPAESDYGNYEEETDGFGTGAFTRSLTGLPTGDTIYARAYAHNSAGYSYGDEVSFLTKPAAPTNVQATDGVHIDKVVITWTKSAGATGYQVYRDGTPLGWLGDVATFDDTGAGAPSITPGATVASEGAYTNKVALSLSGTGTNNGTTHTYKVRAKNATGESVDSDTDTGYRAPGSLTYQWQRSAADSDADYSNITGATASTYNDTGAPAPTITPGDADASDGLYSGHVALSLSGQSANVGAGRYYKCVLNAEGCTQQTSSSKRGYRGVGSLTYQWQRSAADSDADYSNITGATTASYDDTGAPADGSGRYYRCVENATGAAQQISTVDRGYRMPPWSGKISGVSNPAKVMGVDKANIAKVKGVASA